MMVLGNGDIPYSEAVTHIEADSLFISVDTDFLTPPSQLESIHSMLRREGRASSHVVRIQRSSVWQIFPLLMPLHPRSFPHHMDMTLLSKTCGKLDLWCAITLRQVCQKSWSVRGSRPPGWHSRRAVGCRGLCRL